MSSYVGRSFKFIIDMTLWNVDIEFRA